MFLFVGTYTKKEGHVDGKAKGLYIYEIDDSTGEIEYRSVFTDLINPSFLCLHPSLPIIYAVQELTGDTGVPYGRISALSFKAATASLKLINEQSTFGLAPCYVSTDAEAKRAMVANYVNGTVVVYPLAGNGSLEPASQVLKHIGSGPHAQQASPHAHSVMPDPSGKIVLSADKGADIIARYRVGANGLQLQPADPPAISTPAAAGPRHLAFHPSGKYLYCINELDATVLVYKYESESSPEQIQRIDTLPADFDGLKACADIHVHPNGRFLYGSNRGHDSIVIYAIDPESGTLSLLGHEWTRGQFPRNFMVHPNGNFLYAANQNSGNVICFHIEEDGMLTFKGQAWDIPTPVCLQAGF
ncbi:MAG: lactonase family protein [Bacteroidia bacterium]